VELAPEAKGSGEAEPAPEPWRSWVLLLLFFFAFFISLIWVSLFMVPNSSPQAFGWVKTPLQRFSFWGTIFVDSELLFSFGGCARAHPPGVASEPFGGMVLFLQRLLPLSVVVGSIRGIGYMFFTRNACSLYARKPPSPFPTRVDRVLSRLVVMSLIHPFARRRGGWRRTTLDGRESTFPKSCKRVNPSGCPSPIR